jgi:hypothetical protein
MTILATGAVPSEFGLANKVDELGVRISYDTERRIVSIAAGPNPCTTARVGEGLASTTTPAIWWTEWAAKRPFSTSNGAPRGRDTGLVVFQPGPGPGHGPTKNSPTTCATPVPGPLPRQIGLQGQASMNRTGQQRIQHRPRTFQAPEPNRPLQIMSLQAVQAEATSGHFFNLTWVGFRSTKRSQT